MPQSKLIQKLKQTTGISYFMAEKMAGISECYLSKIARGYRRASDKMLKKIITKGFIQSEKEYYRLKRELDIEETKNKIEFYQKKLEQLLFLDSN